MSDSFSRRFPEEHSLNVEARDLLSRIKLAFTHTLPPLGGAFFSKDHLFEGETDHLFGLTWQALYERREEAIFTDLGLIETLDLAYLLPAYMIAGLDYGETDLPHVLLKIFTPSDLQFKPELKNVLDSPQQNVVCCFIQLWIDKGRNDLDLLRAKEQLIDWESKCFHEEQLRLRAAAEYWCAI